MKIPTLDLLINKTDKFTIPIGAELCLKIHLDGVWVSLNGKWYQLPKDNVELAEALAPYFKPNKNYT